MTADQLLNIRMKLKTIAQIATSQAQDRRRHGRVIIREAYWKAVNLGKVCKLECPVEGSGSGEEVRIQENSVTMWDFKHWKK